ncbi:MAG: NADPH-dependent FMN reductase [Pseudobdellovibrio sp.]
MAKILMMGMSLRKDSLNKKLAQNAFRILTNENLNHQHELLMFNDFPMPVYDGDIETDHGIPDMVKQLGQKISEAKALVLSTPEYNGGIPGAFKNAIDWVSRISPMPWTGKKILLLGASPGALGAIRGLGHSRVPLDSIGAFVFPEFFGLPLAHQAFDDAGKLKDPATEERLKKLLLKFSTYVGDQ